MGQGRVYPYQGSEVFKAPVRVTVIVAIATAFSKFRICCSENYTRLPFYKMALFSVKVARLQVHATKPCKNCRRRECESCQYFDVKNSYMLLNF